MAFIKKVDTGSGDIFKFENPGQNLTGIYLGSFEFQGDFAPTYKHLFKTDKGIKTVIGQTHLTSLLGDVQVGSLVRVTFAGTKKGKKGNPMKTYELEIDDEYVADAADVAAAQSAANSDEDADDGDDDTSLDEVKTAAAKTAPRASTPNAANKARVDALFRK